MYFPFNFRKFFIPAVSRGTPTTDHVNTLYGLTPANQQEKRCSDCGILQPLANFYKKEISKLKSAFDKNNPNHYRPHCITCHEERMHRNARRADTAKAIS